MPAMWMRLHIVVTLLAIWGLADQAMAQLSPVKRWFAAGQPLSFLNEGSEAIELVLTRFTGERVERPAIRVEPGATVDLAATDPLGPGTYLLYSVEPGGAVASFKGTPWVVSVRIDRRPGATGGVMVTRIEPLRYAVIEAPRGEMVVGFYYDAAPNTVNNFLSLAEEGFYDGLGFHRIVPGFVIQGGDPKGDSTGGPGYMIDAEFNGRPHLPGVLSMARSGDPLEAQGAMPRSDAANSAGSQFFIALDYRNTRRLDGRYTVFGRVVEGLEVVWEIGEAEIADEHTGQPARVQPMQRVRVVEVTPEANPYAKLFDVDPALLGEPPTRAATQPATQPAGAEADE